LGWRPVPNQSKAEEDIEQLAQQERASAMVARGHTWSQVLSEGQEG
jgi:hypothetical protein